MWPNILWKGKSDEQKNYWFFSWLTKKQNGDLTLNGNLTLNLKTINRFSYTTLFEFFFKYN